MVLQIGTHAGQVVHHVNAVLAQQRCGPDARELQQLRRVHGACAQHHLAGGVGGHHLVAVPHLHAGAAAAAIGLGFDDELRRLCAGPHFKVGPPIAGGAQEGLGRVPAPAAFLVHLEVAHAFVGAAVEVVGGGNAGFLGGLGKGVQHIPAQALLFHAPFAGAAGGFVAVQAFEVFIDALGLVQPPVVFVAAEVGQHVVPTPAVIARQLGPLVVVARLAAHVDHAVDAAAAAQRLAARVAQGAAVQACVGLGVVQPVGARVANAIQVAHGDVDPVVVVLAAGLDQQHAVAAVCAQAVAQQGACGAAADDDVVKLGVAHGWVQQWPEKGETAPGPPATEGHAGVTCPIVLSRYRLSMG